RLNTDTKSRTRTGSATASSTADWPLRRSVALGLDPDIERLGELQRAGGEHVAAQPVVLEVDGQAHEVAGAVAHVPVGRRPGAGDDGPRQRVAVVLGAVHGELAVRLL